jgi:copper(I)-binding protein
MKRIIPCAAAAALMFAATVAQAQLVVKDAWVRATVPQQKATGAFMQVQSAQGGKLVSASSPLTPVVELHEMAMENNVMRMRHVPAIELPAGKEVALKPGGYHVMLMALERQVKEGETVPLVLVFEGSDGKREEVAVQAQVRPLNAGAQDHGHGKH